MNQPAALELVLRRDHLIVTVALGAVIAGSWVYLLTGAGMGMYPHEIAALIPVSVKMAAPMQSPGHGPLGPAGQVHLLQTASARFDPVITGRTELRKPAAM